MYPFSYRNQSNKFVDCAEIPNLIHANAQLIDLRTKEEYDKEHIHNFINIPYPLLAYNVDKIDKSRPVYFICNVGKQSLEISNYLNNLGYDAYSFIGGMHNYKFVANPSYF